MDVPSIAAAIDQTLLKPTIGLIEAAEWVEASKDAGFATLCVSPFLVPMTAEALAGSATGTCSVAGFPLGYAVTESKAEEARRLAELGCADVDMVINVAALLEGSDDYVRDDIAAVVSAVASVNNATIVKVILETAYLAESDIERACRLCMGAGAHYVKTSTGFGPRGASARDCEIMRAVVSDKLGVKAAGGIRDLDAALEMIAAGADRIGTSAGLEIISEAEARGL